MGSEESYQISVKTITNFSLHRHDYIEIFYVMKGSLCITTGDVNFRLDEGHICIVNSGEIHSVNQMNNENHILVLKLGNIKNDFLSTLQNYKFSSSAYLNDLSGGKLPLTELQNILIRIYQEDDEKIPGYQHVVLSLINAFISIMIRNNYLIPKSEKDYITDSSYQRFTEIIEFLEEHFREKISLDELAKQYHMNYFYLSHFFKDTAGISLKTYLNNLRLDKSLPLLAEASNTITHVALDCGFANIRAYTLAFREKFGRLPSDYRKSLLSSASSSNIDDASLIQAFIKNSDPMFSNQSSIRNYLQIPMQTFESPQKNRIITQSLTIQMNEAGIKNTMSQSGLLKIIDNQSMPYNTETLAFLCKNLNINKISILKETVISSNNEDTIFSYGELLKRRLSLFHVYPTINFVSSPNETKNNIHEKNMDGFSLLHSCSILQRYLANIHFPVYPILHFNTERTEQDLFVAGCNLLTENNIPTPGFYVYALLD